MSVMQRISDSTRRSRLSENHRKADLARGSFLLVAQSTRAGVAAYK
jgi:hypothetical protein